MALETTITILLFAIMVCVWAVLYSRMKHQSATEAVKMILDSDKFVEKICNTNAGTLKNDVDILKKDITELKTKIDTLPKPQTPEETTKTMTGLLVPMFQESINLTVNGVLQNLKTGIKPATKPQPVQEVEEEIEQEVEEEEDTPPLPIKKKVVSRFVVPPVKKKPLPEREEEEEDE